MRLIDADKLLEKVYTIENGGVYGDCEVVDRYEIENAPTVEEVSTIEFKEPLPPVKAQKIIRALNKRFQGEWIPISERLPEYTGLYLVSVDDLVAVANFTGNYFMHSGGNKMEVSAWQSLPAPYESLL